MTTTEGAVDIFIFIGPPGAGKGSLASLCIKQFNWLQISTGNLCRKHIAEQTKIGKEIDLIIKSGRLIDDNLITRMVFEWLDENIDKASAIIFDGYPRTVIQAQAFNDMLRQKFPVVRVRVVLFHITDDVVVNRLCSRYVCQNKECQAVYSLSPYLDFALAETIVCDLCSGKLGRRDDDNEIAVRKRLDIYHRHEQQLINFYRDNGIEIITVNALKQLHDVFNDFIQIIGT
ncbi:MAG TPA: nucleoside monophosphate kinase [Candidatus Babeliales bacterium]|nr:nucleoside monophosphate kinase [Candidatus Babeliales bacterium]